MTRDQFEDKVLSQQDKMFRYAASLVFDLEMAKDVVQEVLEKLWKQKDRLDDIDNIPGWCIRITRNTCYDKMRSPKNKTLGLESLHERSALHAIPDQQSEDKDLIQAMHGLLKDLPEQQREIFRLRELLGYSNKEIEGLMLLNEGQVKVNLFRARQKIKHRLTKLMNYGLTK